MRFAAVATAVAAAVAVPLAVAASGPQMSSDQFISAVRCTAYEEVSGAGAGEDVKRRLNAEALRQAPETAAQAQAEVSHIAEEARAGDGALSQERAEACAAASMTAEADSRRDA